MSVCFTDKFSLIKKGFLTLIVTGFFLCSVPVRSQPFIFIDSVNSSTVELYDKFEIFVDLEAKIGGR